MQKCLEEAVINNLIQNLPQIKMALDKEYEQIKNERDYIRKIILTSM